MSVHTYICMREVQKHTREIADRIGLKANLGHLGCEILAFHLYFTAIPFSVPYAGPCPNLFAN